MQVFTELFDMLDMQIRSVGGVAGVQMVFSLQMMS